jgi:BASS family bile acid:Na+ symporter
VNPNYVSLVILAAMICGLLIPAFGVLEPLLLPLLAVLIWLSSLTISPPDILNTTKKPLPHILMVLLCFIILPVISFGVISLFSLPPALTAGYVLAAMAPIAVATPIYTNLLKGNAAIAIAFVAITLLLTPIAVPAMCYLLLHKIITVNVPSMLKILVGIVFIPLLLAFPASRFKRLRDSATPISMLMFFILLATLISLNSGAIFTSEFSKILLALAFLQPILNFAIAYPLSMSWNKKEQIPFVFGLSIRNMALIMTLAAINFGAAAAIPGAFIILAHIVFVIFLIPFFSKK